MCVIRKAVIFVIVLFIVINFNIYGEVEDFLSLNFLYQGDLFRRLNLIGQDLNWRNAAGMSVGILALPSFDFEDRFHFDAKFDATLFFDF